MVEYVKRLCNMINDVKSMTIKQSVMYTNKAELLYNSLAGKKEITCIDIPWTITGVVKSSMLEDIKTFYELDTTKENVYIALSASAMINNVEVNVFIGIRRIESHEILDDGTVSINFNIHDNK
jgi:hypothetical protein